MANRKRSNREKHPGFNKKTEKTRRNLEPPNPGKGAMVAAMLMTLCAVFSAMLLDANGQVQWMFVAGIFAASYWSFVKFS